MLGIYSHISPILLIFTLLLNLWIYVRFMYEIYISNNDGKILNDENRCHNIFLLFIYLLKRAIIHIYFLHIHLHVDLTNLSVNLKTH